MMPRRAKRKEAKSSTKPRWRKVRHLVHAAAAEMSRKVRSDDKRFWSTVVMHHDDGSCATWVSANVHEYDKDWIFIFTEHHGFFVYEREFVAIHEFEWRYRGERVCHIRHPKTDPGPLYVAAEDA